MKTITCKNERIDTLFKQRPYFSRTLYANTDRIIQMEDQPCKQRPRYSSEDHSVEDHFMQAKAKARCAQVKPTSFKCRRLLEASAGYITRVNTKPCEQGPSTQVKTTLSKVHRLIYAGKDHFFTSRPYYSFKCRPKHASKTRRVRVASTMCKLSNSLHATTGHFIQVKTKASNERRLHTGKDDCGQVSKTTLCR